jgi:Na+/serine symporter
VTILELRGSCCTALVFTILSLAYRVFVSAMAKSLIFYSIRNNRYTNIYDWAGEKAYYSFFFLAAAAPAPGAGSPGCSIM